MNNHLYAEFIKCKRSSLLKITFLFPLLFLVHTLLTLLASRTPSGLHDGKSIIQITILNLWGISVIFLALILSIAIDKRQEQKALGFERACANHWNQKAINKAKFFKFILLGFLAHLALFSIIIFSNLVTTGTTDFWDLFICLMGMWFSTIVLIPFNMFLISKMKTLFVLTLNMMLSITGVIFLILFSSLFWVFPWTYPMRFLLTMGIDPNGTLLEDNFYVHNYHFLLYFIPITVLLCYGSYFFLLKRKVY